jgi:urease accessory protein
MAAFDYHINPYLYYNHLLKGNDMLIEKIIGNTSERHTELRVDTVPFEWFEQNRKILRKTSSTGEEVGLRLSAPLRDGDILFEDAQRVLVAALIPCELICAAVSGMTEMGRLCFELGNRHLPLAISESGVKTPYDAPTFEYLTRLGFDCRRVREKFSGYTEVKSHEHADAHTRVHSHG